MKKPINRTLSFWLFLILLIAVILIIRHFNHKSQPSIKPAQPVVAAKVTTKSIPVYLSALGTVTSLYAVTVRTQINGQLLKVFFEEGQMVKKGQLLAQIDPRPYEAQLLQYQGQLERDQASLQNAKLDLKRYQKLWQQDSVAKQTLDTQIATVKQAEGTIKIDEGLLENTKVNLAYTQIRSPLDGRVGLRLVDPGNYVQVSDANGIATITMLHPIAVVFTIPEDDVPRVLEKMHQGKKLIVEAYDRSQKKLLARGALTTIDNQIDITTGTVKLKAEFPNNDQKLFPNQFVNIQLLLHVIPNAIVVPSAAIQHSATGTFVYRVNADNTVSAVPVTVGTLYGNDTLVTKGVAPNEVVVIEGADKITNGTTVQITQALTAASA